MTVVVVDKLGKQRSDSIVQSRDIMMLFILVVIDFSIQHASMLIICCCYRC